MHSLKVALFIAFCLLSVAAVGTSVSHLWTTNKVLNNEESAFARLRRGSQPQAPAIRPADDAKP
jgi:hypothetical protein